MFGMLIFFILILQVMLFAAWLLSYAAIYACFRAKEIRTSARPSFLFPYLLATITVVAWPIVTQQVIDPIFEMNVSQVESVLFNGIFYGGLLVFVISLGISKYKEL